MTPIASSVGTFPKKIGGSSENVGVMSMGDELLSANRTSPLSLQGGDEKSMGDVHARGRGITKIAGASSAPSS